MRNRDNKNNVEGFKQRFPKFRHIPPLMSHTRNKCSFHSVYSLALRGSYHIVVGAGGPVVLWFG